MCMPINNNSNNKCTVPYHTLKVKDISNNIAVMYENNIQTQRNIKINSSQLDSYICLRQ